MTGQVLVNGAMPLVRTDLVRTEDDQLELAVREHARLVYRVAYSVLRDHHDAEDAASSARQRACVQVGLVFQLLDRAENPGAGRVIYTGMPIEHAGNRGASDACLLRDIV